MNTGDASPPSFSEALEDSEGVSHQALSSARRSAVVDWSSSGRRRVLTTRRRSQLGAARVRDGELVSGLGLKHAVICSDLIWFPHLTLFPKLHQSPACSVSF